MKKLTKDQVIHIAKLSGLFLTSKEIIKFEKQLSDILGYIEILNKLETSGVIPSSQVTGLENVLREDKIEPGLSQEEALFGTNNKQNGYFKVKAVLENA